MEAGGTIARSCFGLGGVIERRRLIVIVQEGVKDQRFKLHVASRSDWPELPFEFCTGALGERGKLNAFFTSRKKRLRMLPKHELVSESMGP